MRLISLLLAAVTILLGSALNAEVITKGNSAVIYGPITFNAVMPFSTQLLAKGEKIAQDGKVLNLVIDSPGGSTIAGGVITDTLEAIRALGVRIDCYVPHMAASLAFQILLHCDTRTGLPGSLYLWHRARVQISNAIMTGPQAEVLARDLLETDDLFFADILTHLDGDEVKIRYSYENELLHSASSLVLLSPKFLQVVKFIPGLLNVLGDHGVLNLSAFTNPMGMQFIPGETIYISGVSK